MKKFSLIFVKSVVFLIRVSLILETGVFRINACIKGGRSEEGIFSHGSSCATSLVGWGGYERYPGWRRDNTQSTRAAK